MSGVGGSEGTDAPGFVPASGIPRTDERRRAGATSSMAAAMAEAGACETKDLALPVSALVVTPELSVLQAKALWTAVLDLRDVILGDAECFDDIDGTREMNRTGATRLATAFGLSIDRRSIEEGRVELADLGEYDYRFRVEVRVSKGSRFVDGIGTCRLSEISERARTGPGSLSQREHFALTKAWTRAAKRAIADILGGTEA